MTRARRVAHGLGIIVLSATLLAGCPDSDPTGPDPIGVTSLAVVCPPAASAPLRCTATIRCAAGPCPPTLAPDVTAEAVWVSEPAGIVTIPAPGQVVAAAPGDTVVRATWRGVTGQATVSVFVGLPPQPTTELSGVIYQAGRTPATGPIDGARVEVVGGTLSGRAVTSGTAAPLPPGFSAVPVGSGSYRLAGIPPGTYHLRITRTGFVPQERDVVVPAGGTTVNIEMAAQ